MCVRVCVGGKVGGRGGVRSAARAAARKGPRISPLTITEVPAGLWGRQDEEVKGQMTRGAPVRDGTPEHGRNAGRVEQARSQAAPGVTAGWREEGEWSKWVWDRTAHMCRRQKIRNLPLLVPVCMTQPDLLCVKYDRASCRFC